MSELVLYSCGIQTEEGSRVVVSADSPAELLGYLRSRSLVVRVNGGCVARSVLVPRADFLELQVLSGEGGAMSEELVKVLVGPLADALAERLKGEFVVVPERGLSVKEASKATGISVSKLGALIRANRVKVCPEKPVRIPRSEVARLNAQTEASPQ